LTSLFLTVPCHSFTLSASSFIRIYQAKFCKICKNNFKHGQKCSRNVQGAGSTYNAAVSKPLTAKKKKVLKEFNVKSVTEAIRLLTGFYLNKDKPDMTRKMLEDEQRALEEIIN